jgi:hypothetical protein
MTQPYIPQCHLRGDEKAPEADSYKAGKCPQCGEFAVGTWCSPAAPVFCRNAHMWHRPGQTVDRMSHPCLGTGNDKSSTNDSLWGY